MRFAIQEPGNSFNGTDRYIVEVPNRAAAVAFFRTCGFNEAYVTDEAPYGPSDEERAMELTQTRDVPGVGIVRYKRIY